MKLTYLLPLIPSVGAFLTSPSAFRATSKLQGKPKVFIDGEAGTTGIQVFDRLEKRDDLEILSIPFDLRKDEETRKKFINEADAVILCKLLVVVSWRFSVCER